MRAPAPLPRHLTTEVAEHVAETLAGPLRIPLSTKPLEAEASLELDYRFDSNSHGV